MSLIPRQHHRQLHCQCTIFENIRKRRELKVTKNIIFVEFICRWSLLVAQLSRLVGKPLSPDSGAGHEALQPL